MFLPLNENNQAGEAGAKLHKPLLCRQQAEAAENNAQGYTVDNGAKDVEALLTAIGPFPLELCGRP